jgi:hypothetical protein
MGDAEEEALLARAIKETEIGHCCYGEDPLPKAKALLGYLHDHDIALVELSRASAASAPSWRRGAPPRMLLTPPRKERLDDD